MCPWATHNGGDVQMGVVKAERFTALKAKVKAEMLRRNQSGSVAGYGGSAYDYTVAPSAGKTVQAEHRDKLVTPMRAVNSDQVPASSGPVIRESELANLETRAAVWAARPVTDNSGSDCKSGCTGMCYTGCATGCSGCGSGCPGSCSGCGSGCPTGCSGCGSGCPGSCSGCGSGCSDSCDGCDGCSGCGSGCDTGCSGCGSGCPSGCSSCGGGCSTSCTGCGSGCPNNCSSNCEYNK